MSTSVSNPPNDSTPASPRAAKNPGNLRRWVIVISAVLLSLLLLGVIRTQGYVSGEEFSPTHFQRRQFSFYEIPLIHLQITPIKRTGTTPVAATYIRQNGLIKPYTGVPTTWHLVSISRGLTGSTPRDAQLLIHQLLLDRSGASYWRQWSIDHPMRAKKLWPVIQRLAERELYILMPELFEMAQVDSTPDQLAEKIDQLLRRRYRDLIQDVKSADRAELAMQLLAEAADDYPDDESFKELAEAPP